MGIIYNGVEYEYGDSGDLCRRIQKYHDKDAMEIMIILHDGLVQKIVEKYYTGANGPVGRDDFVQVGRLGIIDAAKKYNPDAGAFSTYAYFWVAQKIQREITDRGNAIRIPNGTYQKIQQLLKLQGTKLSNLDRTDFVKAAAKEMGTTEDEIESLLEANDTQTQLVRMDIPIKGEYSEKLKIADIVPNGEPDFAETIARNESIQKWLPTVFEGLSEKERIVLSEYYDLDGQGGKTMTAIGKELGITHQRAAQLIKSGIKKLHERAVQDDMMQVLEYYVS